ncbi:MAG: hypothetical protein JWM41_140 [Gemmatimonadetes bacterium]|nr:hypothetical protein [Gemmatimonadota bacterium]
MGRPLRILKVLALFTMTARVLTAQVIEGSVVLRDSTTYVAGAIVFATDAHGATAARTLTSARGTFVLRLPSAGQYNLEVLRIGYRPTQGPSVTVAAGATQTIHIFFAAEPVALTAVNVRERETCRVNADSGLAVARVWEEARKAMLSSQLSEEAAPLFAEWIEYERTLDSTARLVREQHVRTSRHPTTHAFRSLPARTLSERGYVAEDSGATMFFAPDADVLLSEEFVSEHCFRLATAPAGDAGLIGVAFQPTRERRDKHDIEGTLWLDRTSAELRTLEFRYTSLPDAAMAANPGGRVDFLRVMDGIWLVSRWNVRMPQLVASARRSADGTRRTLMSLTPLVLRSVQTNGGEVTRVLRHDSLVYQAAGADVAVQVLTRDTLLKATGATLTLDGTDYTAAADPLGRIQLTPVLEGRYRARVRTPFMDSLGVPPTVREVEARQDTHVDSLFLPSARDALAKACPRDSIANGEGMLRGRVSDEQGRVIKQAAVTIGWDSDVTNVNGHIAGRARTVGVLTDDFGYWQACGVPQQRVLSVRGVADAGADIQKARLDGVPFGAVDLVLHSSSEAQRQLDLMLGRENRASALVELAVVNASGTPLPDVTLEVTPQSGAARTLVTGAGGKALLADVAPGVVSVRARRVGFTAGLVAATVEAGRNTVPIILSAAAAPTLDTVRIVGDRRVFPRLEEFETRRLNHAAAASFSRADIVKRNPTEIWQMLTGVPSMTVTDRIDRVVAVSGRTMLANKNGDPCFMSVMVDGLLMRNDPGAMSYDLRKLPRPEEIHGVEVFAGAATIPLQYGGVGAGKMCGLIAIWTR